MFSWRRNTIKKELRRSLRICADVTFRIFTTDFGQVAASTKTGCCSESFGNSFSLFDTPEFPEFQKAPFKMATIAQLSIFFVENVCFANFQLG